MSEICWLGQPECHEASHVGSKAANISRMAATFNVPRGFALSVEAFDRWAPDLKKGMPSVAALPDDFRKAVAEAYLQLSQAVGTDDPAVAVRSSATDEDSEGASFAGQHDTYLNIRGIDAVLDGILKCWASLYNEEALQYRQSNALDVENSRMAVLVQHLVPADSSGVVFSANPVTGNRDEIMVNMSFGLGESIVAGRVTPDSYVVSRPDLLIKSEHIAEKLVMTVSEPDGTKEVQVPRIMRSIPSGTPEHVIDAARLAASLEKSLGWPVDAEFAFHESRLYLLQARPITTL